MFSLFKVVFLALGERGRGDSLVKLLVDKNLARLTCKSLSCLEKVMGWKCVLFVLSQLCGYVCMYVYMCVFITYIFKLCVYIIRFFIIK